MFQTKVVEKIKTRVLCAIAFLSKIVPFMRKCVKTLLSQTSQSWQYNNAHALCMPSDKARDTLRIRLAFALQHRLRERGSLLRLYVRCLSSSQFTSIIFVVYVGMELDFHQLLYRQILRVKGRVAFRWVVLYCHQSDYLSDKKDSKKIH